MDGHEGAGVEVGEGLGGAVGAEVDFVPEGVEGADFEQGEVEGSVLLADGLEAGPEAGVAAEVDVVGGAAEGEGGPEGVEAVPGPAAGEVAGGEGSQGELRALWGAGGVADDGGFGPVELGDGGGGDTERGEDFAYTLRGDPAQSGAEACEGADGACAEMIVVIVGDEDGVEGGQVFEREGGGEEAFGAEELDGRGALVPDGVGKEGEAVELEQDGGVAEPGDAQAGGGGLEVDGRVGGEWAEGLAGFGFSLVEEKPGKGFQDDFEAADRCGDRVLVLTA